MKVFTLKIEFPDSVSDEDLEYIGEDFQKVLPVNYEQDGVLIGDVSFEFRSKVNEDGSS